MKDRESLCIPAFQLKNSSNFKTLIGLFIRKQKIFC